jgi:hypothetical protein
MEHAIQLEKEGFSIAHAEWPILEQRPSKPDLTQNQKVFKNQHQSEVFESQPENVYCL